MARRIPPLTEMACRRKSYNPAGGNKLFDGGGLYLKLRPSGAKLWRLKYRFAGKERLLSIGSYPEVSSEQARATRAEAKTLLANDIVGHWFRHMASTLLNEQGWSPDAIERQLAHKEKGIRAVYNRAEYLPERRKMMQAWADHLEALKASAVRRP